MTKFVTFEDYLGEVFMADYIGTKETYEDDFDRWLSQLDGEEYIKLGNEYGELRDMRAART